MLPFNTATYVPTLIDYVQEAFTLNHISGDGGYTKKCQDFFEKKINVLKVLLTTSGTHALDLAAILSEINPGDEVILPSYTFSSTANAFALRGASLVFIDLRPDTLNLDETLIEDAITDKTKLIATVDYAGVSAEYDVISEIARHYNLFVVEDAAQAVGSMYKSQYCGTLGDIGCFSFHETKNFSMGEGGAFITNRSEIALRAEIIREKGTDRKQFFRGQVNKYQWQDIGSSYLPSDILAAYLWAQLENYDQIATNRMESWLFYNENLQDLKKHERVTLPYIPPECTHNAHLFSVRVRDMDERTRLIQFLNENDVYAPFHYIPLHSAPAGLKFGRFHGEDRYTTKESERLLRLPLYYNLKSADRTKVVELLYAFYKYN